MSDIVERLRRVNIDAQTADEAADEIERLRALLVRYQAANYIPEDCDLYAETKCALEERDD